MTRSLHVRGTGRHMLAAGIIPPRQISRAYLERLQGRCETLRANMRSAVNSVEMTYWTRHYGRARTRYRLAFDRYEAQLRGWR